MDSELPAYSPPIPPPSHSAGSSTNTTQPGSLHSSSLEDTAHHTLPPPYFYQGDTISGQVDVNAHNSESIKGITVKLTAAVLGNYKGTFVKIEKELWAPSIPLPHGPKVSKLGEGQYSWPFSFTLPNEVEVHDRGTMKKFPLPPNFSEKVSAAYIDYKLTVTIKRGAFNVDIPLYTNFSYVPLTRPEPPSRMMQKAYNENLPLVGPEGDPDGWHVLPSVTIHGKIFDSRSVEVTFSLAFAKPDIEPLHYKLTYARGTAAPLWLTLTGDDEQALDLLSSPMATELLMIRSLATGPEATKEDIEQPAGSFFLETVARAVFWAPRDALAPGKRVLQGQVDIKRSLKASTLFPSSPSEYYYMELRSFKVPGFVATTHKTGPLLRQKMTVVNFGAEGVTMRSHAPPEYVPEQDVDYASSAPFASLHTTSSSPASFAMDFEPPAYSLPLLPSPSLAHSAGSSTSPTRAGSLHSISLEDSKGHKWLTLAVNSRAPHPSFPPCFYQGDAISGQVGIDALKSESIKGITLKLSATTIHVRHYEETFLKTETELWTPSIPLPDSSKVSKLGKGKYSWPFSLTLPAEVEVQDRGTVEKFPLPASFSENASVAYLDYALTVTIKRGGFRVDTTLSTNFAYVPLTRPGPPSRMMQKAYSENLPLVGPEGDPDGWHVLPSVFVQGKIFDARFVEVALSLAFAKPLTYARGTAAPLWLTLTGVDEQALDLLSAPNAIKLLLVRSLATGADATSEVVERRAGSLFSQHVARAVFWAPKDASAPGKRILQGEADLKRSIKPSTSFPKFAIRYHMELQPFETPGFVACSS
ncbi:hypothetical protein BU15DRAFT_79246 [Melanogaster broomeanus]|nr:hypothetical protein BU15DRAFT_79246 [Melanogaster broomeanus]